MNSLVKENKNENNSEQEEQQNENVNLINNDLLVSKIFDDRKIIFNSTVDEQTITHAWLQFECLKKKDSSPIFFYINCSGGSTYDVGFFIDYMRSINIPIVTIGMGCCLSAGFLLLISGHYRYAYSKTALMIHQTSISSPMMTLPALRNYVDVSVKEEDGFINTMVSQSFLNKKEIYEKMHNKDWYMSAEEAIKYGFIDEIIHPKWNIKNKQELLTKFDKQQLSIL